jgi:L-ascorbate metabolism protein UlaG (beta-lactamase superfamily)
MDVTWLGHGCFRLRGKNAAVITDPYPPGIGLRLAKQDADLVTISHEHDNHSYAEVVRGEPYLIKGPGEYEVKDVSVIGLPAFHDAEKGAKRGRNTVYLIEIDDVRICHLGDLGHKLEDADAETVASVDVLLVPVGGRTAINAVEAAEVVRQLEPRYVVPMHYAIPGLKVQLDPIDRFLKEMGVAAAEAQPKLSVQKSSVSEYETKVVVLEPKAEPR